MPNLNISILSVEQKEVDKTGIVISENPEEVIQNLKKAAACPKLLNAKKKGYKIEARMEYTTDELKQQSEKKTHYARINCETAKIEKKEKDVIIKLVDLEDLEAVAEYFNISLKTVGTYLSRAKERVRLLFPKAALGNYKDLIEILNRPWCWILYLYFLGKYLFLFGSEFDF